MTDLEITYKRLRSYLAPKERDPKYLKFVRSLPCCRCGSPAEPHHIFGSYGSLKTSDYGAVPLCRNHHQDYELGRASNPELVEEVVKTLVRYIRK
jgi:hypothetical protein